MKEKKIPLRTCIGCLTIRPKRELARIYINDQGMVVSDPTGKGHGRGAYLCRLPEEIKKNQEDLKRKDDQKITPNPECVEKAKEKKAFRRAFRQSIKGIEI